LTERAIELVLIFTSILFIVDPFAVIPTFLAMTARDAPAQRRMLARRGAWTCAITLIAFALGGSLIFKIFGITIGAFKIAGGVLIGLNALDMVQARRSQQRETPIETAEGIQKDDIGIMPLGVPMLAGPGAISTVMVLALGAKSTAAMVTVYVSIVFGAVGGLDSGAAARPDGDADPDPAHGLGPRRDRRPVHHRRHQIEFSGFPSNGLVPEGETPDLPFAQMVDCGWK
jgi:MarC family membrane protein